MLHAKVFIAVLLVFLLSVTALAEHSLQTGLTTRTKRDWGFKTELMFAASGDHSGQSAEAVDSLKSKQRPYGHAIFGRTAFQRNVLRDAKFVGKSAWSDLVWVYSSPTRFAKRSALTLAAIVASGATIYFFDEDIARTIQRNKEEWPVKPLHEFGEKLEPVGRQATMNKYFLGTAVVSYTIGFEWLARMSSEVLESYLIAGLPKYAVNKITGRQRPLDGYDYDHWNFFQPGQSFFSGHTSHAFQIARVMDEHIHFVPADIFLYFCAASVGVQRVDTGWHWPSDVYIGGIYGFVVADALMGRHRMRWLDVEPYSFGSANGVNFTVRF
jgi:undecaprenyl-diphosphatase